MMLQNKKIVLGVSGSIAAYKSAELIRLLVKEGCEVKVIMTESAKAFITPLTLATLSKNEVLSSYYNSDNGVWHNHVELGLWADLMLIAPASANTLAKMAVGLCDNLLLATFLSARCPVFIAPAMDLDMLSHAATQHNLKLLQQRNTLLIESETGELASGLYGKGRMAEPEHILAYLRNHFNTDASLTGFHALVTAGPTYENLDPVRFIGNYSSGKMGFAIARCLAENGAKVTLVSGPTHLQVLHPNITRENVTSAEEMFQACMNHAASQEIIVMSAAVADYKPEQIAQQKIKKKDLIFLLKLNKTKDILKEMGAMKKKGQILVGFALETNDELKNAQEKLKNKNLDFVVLNSLKDEGAGFKSDNNKITIIDKKNNVTEFPLKSKDAVAADIVNKIIELTQHA
jgi:phosphopantothenoylcysteine decarboxylase/phosphopantothenate--cysteine ligase